MEKKITRKEILDNIRWEVPKSKGGMQIALLEHKMILQSDDFDISITVGASRSQHRNREIAMAMFKYFLDNEVKFGVTNQIELFPEKDFKPLDKDIAEALEEYVKDTKYDKRNT